MTADPGPRTPKPPRPNWEMLRILVMGGVLAGLLYVAFFHRPGGQIDDPTYFPNEEVQVPVPQLDTEILAEVKDDTREDRIVLEARPLRHLLEKSLDVVPTVARALGMPEEVIPATRIRANKDKFRGRYLWFKGVLESLSPPRSGHPVDGYSLHEATLRTSEGDHVLFSFSMAPDPDLRPGDWVRAEGFFLKLRDLSAPERVVEAPMLVGPRLFRDYAEWEGVTELDHAILERLKDGHLVDDGTGGTKRFEPTPDSDRILERDQGLPLWHLASYAQHQQQYVTKADWRRLPAINEKTNWLAIRNGEIEKGTPMRILGDFIDARTLEAQVNPIGAKHWTQALVRVRDLGGKLIFVWIPDKLPPMRAGTGLEVRGFLYKRHTYETLTGEHVISAVFVAPKLDLYTTEVHPMAKTLAWSFGGLVGVVVILFFLMARKDRRITERNEAAMIERRRKRRAKALAGSTP